MEEPLREGGDIEVTKGGLAIQAPAKTGTGTRKSVHCEVVWS